MRITEIWKSKDTPTVSFEVYPARTEKAAESFERALDKLVDLRPDFFSVTFGAGGSTREGSRELVRKLRQDKRQDVLAYVACFGLGPEELDEVIGDYRSLGVQTMLTPPTFSGTRRRVLIPASGQPAIPRVTSNPKARKRTWIF